MNPVTRSERTVDFTIANVSKIPRWCRPNIAHKAIGDSSNCMRNITFTDNAVHKSASSVVKLPPIYTKTELTAICEPLPLQEEALQAVRKAKQDRQKVNERLTEAVAYADFLKQGLKEVKEKIERISRELESPVADSFLEYAGESEVQNPELLLAKHNHQLQQDLLIAVDEEDNLTQKLENAHRQLWEAGLADNSLSLEVESELNPIIDAYDTREEFMMQKRAFREKHIKQAANLRRLKTLKIAKKTLVESSQAQTRRKNQIAHNIIGAKDARKRIDHHLKKSMQTRKENKLLLATDQKLKQDRQHKLLSHLKTEMEEQQAVLTAHNEVRKKRLRRMEYEKERIRQHFIQDGKNPYFVEHLLVIEERRAQVQRKILQRETERLIQLQKDYENNERAKFRAEFQKRKWDRFWAKKFAEKKRERIEKETEYFLKDGFGLNYDKNNEDKYEEDVAVVVEYLPDCSTLDKHTMTDVEPVPEEQEKAAKPPIKSIKKSARRSKRNLTKNDGGGDVLVEHVADKDFGSLPNDENNNEINNAEATLEQVEVLDEQRGKEKCKPKADEVKMLPKRKAGSKPSFRCHPDVVIFSDFELGKIYKKTLTITNISAGRLKFSLKEFTDDPKISHGQHSTDKKFSEKRNNQNLTRDPEKANANEVTTTPIKELVKVKNQVSKALSPGLTHDIHLTFTPQSLNDQRGYLVFDSPLESFQVLVECLKKRFIPELTPSKAVFTNVVSKTSAFMIVKIVNKGAKPGLISHLEQNSPVTSYFGKEHKIKQKDPPAVTHQELETPTPSEIQPAPSAPSVSSTKGSKKRRYSKNERRPSLIKEAQTQTPAVAVETPDQTGVVENILGEIVDSVTDGIFLSYFKECNRQINGNATRNLVIFFRPKSVDTYRTRLELQFDDPEVKNLTLDVEGISVENPISVNPPASDLKICMMDCSYQQVLTLSTSIQGTGKVVPEVLPELRTWVQIYPKKVTVSAKNPAKFTVKFLPRAAILQDHSSALQYVDRSTKIIDFPILFHLSSFPCKVQSPVSVTIMAILTNQQVECIPPEIDMGKCSRMETVRSSFVIVNNCMLPQEIGFVGNPKCIMIQPNYGFAKLLPFEKRPFDILLSLPGDSPSGDLSFTLKYQTLQEREYFLNVRAFAKPSLVQLSDYKILFPVTTVGSDAFTTVEIFSKDHRNTPERKPTKFEFAIDPDFPIKITPRAGYLKKGSRVKLAVEFHVDVSETQVKQHLTKFLETEYVHHQATLQRELDGINQTLKYEMVLKEDLNPEFNDTGISTDKTQCTSESLEKISSVNSKSGAARRNGTKTKSATSSRGNDGLVGTKALKKGDKKSFVQEAYDALQSRRNEVVSLIGAPFKSPDPIDVHSEEFSMAKHDLLKTMGTSSQNYSIPCFVTDPDGEVDVLTLHVQGVVSGPSLIILEDSNTIDFSAVRGGHSYGQIRLHNISSSTITPKVGLLNPLGPFVLCNALRQIFPGHIFTLKFRFQPKEAKSFSETIGVTGGGSHFVLTLNGSCT